MRVGPGGIDPAVAWPVVPPAFVQVGLGLRVLPSPEHIEYRQTVGTADESDIQLGDFEQWDSLQRDLDAGLARQDLAARMAGPRAASPLPAHALGQLKEGIKIDVRQCC
jgi:hypothetical protein